MLVVTRRPNESLIINDNIEVIIIEARDGNVKIGIDAPKHIKIYRKEIFDEIKAENKKALSADKDEISELIRKVVLE